MCWWVFRCTVLMFGIASHSRHNFSVSIWFQSSPPLDSILVFWFQTKPSRFHFDSKNVGWIPFRSPNSRVVSLCHSRKLAGFYFPKGAAKAEPKVVQLFLLMFYFCVRKRILDFQFWTGNPPFWDLENVLSPEGTLRKQNPYGVHLLFFPFYCV